MIKSSSRRNSVTGTVNRNVYDLLKHDATRIYVIAEAGIGQSGSQERALALVRAATWAGADAVKFTAFPAERPGQPSRQGLIPKPGLSYDAFRALFKEAKRLNIDFLSTPSDEEAADFLHQLGISAFRMAAGDIRHRPLIEHVSRKGKPVLLSTAASRGDEIEKAIGWMHRQSNDQAILLHGVSSLPARREELHLKSVEYLRERFGQPVGFSDDSFGTLGSTVAVSLGAQVIERHFVIETHGDGTDLAVSMDVKQLKRHIEELRTIGQILGTPETSAGNTGVGHKTEFRSIPPAPPGFFPEPFGQVAGTQAL